MRKHHAAILRSPVRTLPVQLRRIVQREKRIQKSIERQPRWIERQIHHLGMTRPVCAHLFVCGMLHISAFISHRRIKYSRHLCESGFHAPKTSSSKCCLFDCHFALLLYCPDGSGPGLPESFIGCPLFLDASESNSSCTSVLKPRVFPRPADPPSSNSISGSYTIAPIPCRAPPATAHM